jgi:hypothetical protein
MKKSYPIFVPQRGALEFKGESVLVFAKSSMVADALTRITLILGRKSSQILTRFDV